MPEYGKPIYNSLHWKSTLDFFKENEKEEDEKEEDEREASPPSALTPEQEEQFKDEDIARNRQQVLDNFKAEIPAREAGSQPVPGDESFGRFKSEEHEFENPLVGEWRGAGKSPNTVSGRQFVAGADLAGGFSPPKGTRGYDIGGPVTPSKAKRGELQVDAGYKPSGEGLYPDQGREFSRMPDEYKYLTGGPQGRRRDFEPLGFVDPENPTIAELKRRGIQNSLLKLMKAEGDAAPPSSGGTQPFYHPDNTEFNGEMHQGEPFPDPYSPRSGKMITLNPTPSTPWTAHGKDVKDPKSQGEGARFHGWNIFDNQLKRFAEETGTDKPDITRQREDSFRSYAPNPGESIQGHPHPDFEEWHKNDWAKAEEHRPDTSAADKQEKIEMLQHQMRMETDMRGYRLPHDHPESDRARMEARGHKPSKWTKKAEKEYHATMAERKARLAELQGNESSVEQSLLKLMKNGNTQELNPMEDPPKKNKDSQALVADGDAKRPKSEVGTNDKIFKKADEDRSGWKKLVQPFSPEELAEQERDDPHVMTDIYPQDPATAGAMQPDDYLGRHKAAIPGATKSKSEYKKERKQREQEEQGPVEKALLKLMKQGEEAKRKPSVSTKNPLPTDDVEKGIGESIKGAAARAIGLYRDTPIRIGQGAKEFGTGAAAGAMSPEAAGTAPTLAGRIGERTGAAARIGGEKVVGQAGQMGTTFGEQFKESFAPTSKVKPTEAGLVGAAERSKQAEARTQRQANMAQSMGTDLAGTLGAGSGKVARRALGRLAPRKDNRPGYSATGAFIGRSIENSLLKLMKEGEIIPSKVGMAKKDSTKDLEKVVGSTASLTAPKASSQPAFQDAAGTEAAGMDTGVDYGRMSNFQAYNAALGATDVAAGIPGKVVGAGIGTAKLGVGAGIGTAKLGVGAAKKIGSLFGGGQNGSKPDANTPPSNMPPPTQNWKDNRDTTSNTKQNYYSRDIT